MATELAFQAAKSITDILTKRGHQARLVGGAVRDMQLGLEPNDYDLATTMKPDDVFNLFAGKGFSLSASEISKDWSVYPIGLQHGTVILVNKVSGVSIEVTTLRRDEETDGRHAKVSFDGVSWEDDAKRRDFTINAMSYDIHTSTLHDYYGGQQAILDRVIEFVGDPYERIREDYLRILRLFRFIGKTGFAVGKYVDTYRAIQDMSSKLKTDVSKERILSELLQIVSTPHRWDALEQMNRYGVSEALFGFRFWIDAMKKAVEIDGYPFVGTTPDYVILFAGLPVDAFMDYPLTKAQRRYLNARLDLNRLQLIDFKLHASMSVQHKAEAFWISAEDHVEFERFEILNQELFTLTGKHVIEADPKILRGSIGEVLSYARNYFVKDGISQEEALKKGIHHYYMSFHG